MNPKPFFTLLSSVFVIIQMTSCSESIKNPPALGHVALLIEPIEKDEDVHTRFLGYIERLSSEYFASYTEASSLSGLSAIRVEFKIEHEFEMMGKLRSHPYIDLFKVTRL